MVILHFKMFFQHVQKHTYSTQKHVLDILGPRSRLLAAVSLEKCHLHGLCSFFFFFLRGNRDRRLSLKFIDEEFLNEGERTDEISALLWRFKPLFNVGKRSPIQWRNKGKPWPPLPPALSDTSHPGLIAWGRRGLRCDGGGGGAGGARGALSLQYKSKHRSLYSPSAQRAGIAALSEASTRRQSHTALYLDSLSRIVCLFFSVKAGDGKKRCLRELRV